MTKRRHGSWNFPIHHNRHHIHCPDLCHPLGSQNVRRNRNRHQILTWIQWSDSCHVVYVTWLGPSGNYFCFGCVSYCDTLRKTSGIFLSYHVSSFRLLSSQRVICASIYHCRCDDVVRVVVEMLFRMVTYNCITWYAHHSYGRTRKLFLLYHSGV